MNGEMQIRIKLLLSPAIALAQCIAIICWVVVLLITPSIHYGSMEVLLTVALLGTCVWQYCASGFTVWRIVGIVFVVVVALCFSRASELNRFEGVNWSLPIAVMITLCSTLLVVYTRDYLLVTVVSWAILAPMHDVESGSAAYFFMVLFFVASVSLGMLLNHTYTRTLRDVLTMERKFRELSLTDYLSNLLNRRALMEALEQHAADQSAGYFLMLDIDDFKRINDQWGHDAGDDVIRIMASCLKKTSGSLAVGRLGGEEFGVILPLCSQQEAEDYVGRLLSAIRNAEGSLPFTSSAGLADINENETCSSVLKTADINLYKAKKAGKDRAFWNGVPVAGSSVSHLSLGHDGAPNTVAACD